MKKLFLIALIPLFITSCGEEGVGFNVKKELPVDAPFTIPGLPFGETLNVFDPPRQQEQSTFELSDVSDGIDDLGELSLNNIAYEIADVLEPVALDSITVQVDLDGELVTLLHIDDILQNSPKKNMDLTEAQYLKLEDQIFIQKKLDAIITVDLKELPNENGIDLNFRTFYDVTLKIRQ